MRVLGILQGRLVKHLQDLAAAAGETDGDFAVAVRLQVQLEKSRLASASKVELTKGDPTAVKIAITEQDALANYPWDYVALCKKLSERYTGFKKNPRFHELQKPLAGDEKYSKVRYLDPNKTQGRRRPFGAQTSYPSSTNITPRPDALRLWCRAHPAPASHPRCN
ncbi:MAG: hypothetical protein LH480_09885 [Rubrivivax sp.]|nr:hypothetical protein [Rubrivivax sp.]